MQRAFGLVKRRRGARSEYPLEQPPEPLMFVSCEVGDRPGRARYRAGVKHSKRLCPARGRVTRGGTAFSRPLSDFAGQRAFFV